MKIVTPLVLLAAYTMHAQTVNWYQWSAASAPPDLVDMAMAYDQATRSTLLLGEGATWIFNDGWTQVFPISSPSSRIGAAIAFDGTAGNIVLFGGCSQTGSTCTFLNDTWTWDGTNWAQQFPPRSPSPRVTSLAYDGATKTTLLFGGTGSAGNLQDTWTWDGIAKTWTEHDPPVRPSARQAPLAYDRANQTVVMFGGGEWQAVVPHSGGAALGDTWVWNGTTWAQSFPTTSPTPRSYFSMAYDARIGLVVLFGGAISGDWPNSTDDTWTWNGTNWTQLDPATVPPNRYGFGMAYDSLHNVIVMFGGYSTGPGRNDTWRLALVP
jgi:hypothetical protein